MPTPSRMITSLRQKISSIIKHQNSQTTQITDKDILIIFSNSDLEKSLVYKLLLPILESLKIKYKFNFKVINLYSYNLPLYKINSKIPKKYLTLRDTLNSYTNYIFIFPVWYSSVPAVLKNFIDWSGYWGVKLDSGKKLVGILSGKKVNIIASCWDTRKDYLHKLSASIEYQLVESVFKLYKIKHQGTLIIPGVHNRQPENIKIINNNIHRLVLGIVKK